MEERKMMGGGVWAGMEGGGEDEGGERRRKIQKER